MSAKPKLLCVVGPTASGKTDLAIKLARQFDGEVISADSRTIYRGMDIGTAKPEGEKRPAATLTAEQVEEKGLLEARGISIGALFAEKPYMVEDVPHWGIDITDPDQMFTAADFKVYADQKIDEITRRGKLPILAGGTGLYIQAVVNNLTFTESEGNEDLRKELAELDQEELVERLRVADPEAADTIDVANRRRLERAIEIVERSGKPLRDQQSAGEPKYEVLLLGCDVEREVLRERIEARVDAMVADGLVDEVRRLKERYGCEVNAMTGIGYRQICAFLEGHVKLYEAIETLKRDTRQYAKRQMTWFKRDKRIRWVQRFEEARGWVEEFLA